MLSFMAGVNGGLLAWILAPLFPITAILVGFILGSFGMLLFISLLVHFFSLRAKAVNSQFDDLYRQVQETEVELRSMINVRPLLENIFVPFGGWSVNGRFSEILVRLLFEKRPRMVLECGSGTSTLLAARCLKQIGNGKVVALEHIDKFASATNQRLRENTLHDFATVLETPLKQLSLNGKEMPWYSFDPKAYLQHKIDLLIVDGPPGNTGPLARYPAVPVLKEWLSPNGVIILDDGNREDERKIAEQWIVELNATHEFYSEGKGTWVIQNSLNT